MNERYDKPSRDTNIHTEEWYHNKHIITHLTLLGYKTRR